MTRVELDVLDKLTRDAVQIAVGLGQIIGKFEGEKWSTICGYLDLPEIAQGDVSLTGIGMILDRLHGKCLRGEVR